MAKQPELGARISLKDYVTGPMMNTIRSVESGIRATQDLNKTVKEMSSTSSSSASQFASSMNNISNSTKSASSGAEDFASSVNEIKSKINEATGTGRKFGESMSYMERQTKKAFMSVDGELGDFVRHIQEAKQEMLQMRTSAISMEEMRRSIEKTSVAASKLTSISDTGKQGIKVIQELNEVTRQTQMSLLGLSKDGKISVNTAGATSRLEAYKAEVEAIKSKLNDLKSAGDIASYTAGMNVLNQKMREVEKTIYATASGGRQYISMLKQMGVHTSATANASAIAMEAYKNKFISSLDYMMARTTQSERMYKALGDPTPFNLLTRGCLNVSTALEKMVKQGAPAKIALDQLGKNASMKDLQDRINMINMGIMRMNALAIGMGIVFAASTAIMAKMAIGPSVDEVLKEEQKLTDGYKQTLEERKNEIYSFAGLFEKVNTKAKASGKDLMSALQSQVTSMTEWSKNMQKLSKKGVDEGLIQELQKMGPQAAPQIAALSRMTDSELNKYVNLWKQKHNLARNQATNELEGLREETKKKIEELKGTLTPLGVAAEKFKSTWATALKPFVELWGKIASVFVNIGTKVGEFINRLNETNPAISKMVGMFMYLLPGIMGIMSPLAIGIGLFGGLRAALTSVWAFIGPFVTGFLRVLGPATLVTGAIVLVTGTIMKLWQHSESFRNAFNNVWTGIKGAVSAAIAPIKNAIDSVMKAFNLKPKTDMASFFKSMGDKIAPIINNITSTVLPILTKGFQLVGQGIAAVIKFLIPVFQQIGQWWSANGPMIIQAVRNVANAIGKAFSFILPILKPIFMILKVVVMGAWENIKSVITSGIGIIQSVIGAFAALFTGNWSALWTNIKSLFSNAITFIWNIVQLSFLGKMLGPIKTGFNLIKSIVTGGWSFVRSIFSRSLTGITSVVKGGFNIIRSSISAVMNGIRTVISTIWNSIRAVCGAALNGIKAVFSAVWNGIRAVTSSIWNGIKSTISSAINAVKSVISNGLNNVKTFFSNTWDSILNTVKALPAKFMAFGKGIITGLWDGIKNAAAGMAEKVSDLIDKIVPGPVKKVLGINSPSRLMKQYGSWTMEGLGLGISESAFMAKDAALNAAKSIADIPFASDYTSNVMYKASAASGDKPNVIPGKGGTGSSKSISNNSDKNVEMHNKFEIIIQGGADIIDQGKTKLRELAEEVVTIIVEELETIEVASSDVTREVLV